MANDLLYPVFLRLQGALVLIVGAGPVALRKANTLLEYGARLVVVSPTFAPSFDDLDIERITSTYTITHMTSHNWRLVFAATNSPEVNARVGEDAHRANIFCCRADDGDAGDFVNAAVVRDGGVTVAISTGGGSPVLAGKVRDAIAQHLDPILIAWSAVLPAWREHVKHALTGSQRATLLKRIAGVEMEGILRTYGRERAERILEQWIHEAQAAPALQAEEAPEAPDA